MNIMLCYVTSSPRVGFLYLSYSNTNYNQPRGGHIGSADLSLHHTGSISYYYM